MSYFDPEMTGLPVCIIYACTHQVCSKDILLERHGYTATGDIILPQAAICELNFSVSMWLARLEPFEATDADSIWRWNYDKSHI